MILNLTQSPYYKSFNNVKSVLVDLIIGMTSIVLNKVAS